MRAPSSKHALRSLSDSVLVYLSELDKLVGPERRIPREVGAAIARLSNALEIANDHARKFALGLEITRDAKDRDVRQILERVGG